MNKTKRLQQLSILSGDLQDILEIGKSIGEAAPIHKTFLVKNLIKICDILAETIIEVQKLTDIEDAKNEAWNINKLLKYLIDGNK